MEFLFEGATQQKWRDEDVSQRNLENERRKIDDSRRLVGVKAEQLDSISTQSALIAGFSMVVLVESDKDDGNPVLLILFGISGALVVGLMLTCMLTATFVRVGISRYNNVDRKVGGRDMTFRIFWRDQCEQDWRLALTCFEYGVYSFIIELGLVGWIVFKKNTMGTLEWIIVSTFISVIAFVVLITFKMYTNYKWKEWLMTPEDEEYESFCDEKNRILCDEENQSNKEQSECNEEIELNNMTTTAHDNNST